MSQVMKALQRSELSHQQYSGYAMGMAPMEQASAPQRGFRWYHALWLTLPGLATVAVLGYQGIERQQLAIAQQAATPPAVIDVAAPYQQLAYPDFGPLIRTHVEVPIFDEESKFDDVANGANVALNQTESNKAQPERAEGNTNTAAQERQPIQSTATVVTAKSAPSSNAQVEQQSQMALSELDLSQLSPEMAARVESILKANHEADHSAPEVSTAQALPLVQHSDELTGRLPAMNFQTHVYASNAVKRWVKVNGVEYHEGDKMGDEVQLVAIKPQSTIVRFRNQQIEIPALYDWRG